MIATRGAGVSCCLLLQLGLQTFGSTSDHTDEMLFMRQSEGEMLISPCYPPDIINQSQECWSCECAIYTCTCHCGCVCISNEACVCLCCTLVIFHLLKLLVFMKFPAQAVFKYVFILCFRSTSLKRTYCVRLPLRILNCCLYSCLCECFLSPIKSDEPQQWFYFMLLTDYSCVVCARSFCRWPSR